MLFGIAWKNIWRNKARSAIIIAAIALGLLGGLLASGVSFGMGDQMIATAIQTRLSHIQIHGKNFRETGDVVDTIPGATALLAKIDTMKCVAAAAKRIVLTAMASSPASASGVELIGVDPDREKRITDVPHRIAAGGYFTGPVQNQIVIGQGLAEQLDLAPGSKTVLTFQNDSGALTGAAFRVAGIFKTASSDFDKTEVFVRAQDLHRLMGGGFAWHEIAILLRPGFSMDSAASFLRSRGGDLQVDTWKQLAPDLAYVSESLSATLYVFMLVILAALAFGIVNTMLMAVLERRRELGMLMAVGMRRKTVFGMIVLETIALSLTGALAGMVLTIALMLVLSRTGINLSILSKGLGHLGIPEVLFPSMPFATYPILAIMVIATAIAAAIYPAVKAIRLKPSEALRSM